MGIIKEWGLTNVWRENKIQGELVFGPTRVARLQCGRNSIFFRRKDKFQANFRFTGISVWNLISSFVSKIRHVFRARIRKNTKYIEWLIVMTPKYFLRLEIYSWKSPIILRMFQILWQLVCLKNTWIAREKLLATARTAWTAELVGLSERAKLLTLHCLNGLNLSGRSQLRSLIR